MQNSRSTVLQRALTLLAVVLIVKVTLSVVLGYRDYWPPDFDNEFLSGREAYFFGAYSWAFYTHLVAGPASLVLGLILVSETLRLRWPVWHRSLGKVQAAVVLLLLAPSGLWMAWYAQAGTIAAIGFSLLAIATGTCVLLGWRTAVKRRFAEHRRWMLRCFLLLCSAVVLRMIGGLVKVTGVGADWAYPFASWASWLVPLAAFECIEILRRRARRNDIHGGIRSENPPAVSIHSIYLSHHYSFISFRSNVMSTSIRCRRVCRSIASRCAGTRLATRLKRRALTLVELLVIVAIVGMLACLLLPAVRTTHEPARRNSCMNNVKQLSLAVQNYYDTRKSFPLASTAPLIPVDGIQQYGAVGTASPSAESPTNWTAGQQGDGYSWIAQCLPYMEENALYEKMTAAQDKPVTRSGNLADAAFAPSSNSRYQPTATSDSPFFWSNKMPTFVCPSFPGEDDVDSFGSIPKSKVGTGNYLALAATHYRSSPTNHLESLFPKGVVPNISGHDCTNVPYCGNGGMPFPGVVDGKIQKVGLRAKDFRRGITKTAIIAESREEFLTSWYSGLASYAVAAMPPPNGGDPAAVEVAPGEFTWKCNNEGKCETALNRGGPPLSDPSKYYQPVSPHGGGPRVWGPSGRHPGVVIHGYGDMHTESVDDTIDATVYLQLVERGGSQLSTD